jgi:hypothetical protein
VLLLYQDRLMELQPATLNSPEGAETIDHGPSTCPRRFAVALADHPRAFHLLSESVGDVSASLRGHQSGGHEWDSDQRDAVLLAQQS